jgi:hypothetical protein
MAKPFLITYEGLRTQEEWEVHFISSLSPFISNVYVFAAASSNAKEHCYNMIGQNGRTDEISIFLFWFDDNNNNSTNNNADIHNNNNNINSNNNNIII